MDAKRFSIWISLAILFLGLSTGRSSPRLHADELMDLIKSFVPTSSKADADFPATHKQTRLIQVLPKNDEKGRRLNCFCLDKNDKILAAISDSPGAIQVLDPDGELMGTWSLEINPEAINIGPDGNVLVAGGGKLLRLDPEGSVLEEKDAPHVAMLKRDMQAVREQVIRRNKRMVASMQGRLDTMTRQLRALKNVSEEQEQELLLLQAAIDKTADKREGDLTDAERTQVKLRRELVSAIHETMEAGISEENRQQIERMEEQLPFYRKYIADAGGEAPTEEQIEQQVGAMVLRKSQVASISASGDEVFVATYATKGYGFDVWRMNNEFEEAEKIVTGLRGCCGQMDVQANAAGVFVAENSRHRVCHYDREGELVNKWGKRARKGVVGFGSCCNPMNVAFGKDGSIYAAESGSGRIKRYAADGELLQLVGSVELVPGCKKVSIAISDDGQQVYMLDITRNHIIVMEMDESVAVSAAIATEETHPQPKLKVAQEESDPASN